MVKIIKFADKIDIGSGDGYGDGSGYGDGDGYGYGDGSGYGDGDGSGYGSGYGDGSGSGYGSGSYWLACINFFIKKMDKASRKLAAQLKKSGALFCYWRSDEKGMPCNGGASSMAAHPGMTDKIDGPLEVCTKKALHGTLLPLKWKGNRWWIVALKGEVQGDEEKYGALERVIIGECAHSQKTK